MVFTYKKEKNAAKWGSPQDAAFYLKISCELRIKAL